MNRFLISHRHITEYVHALSTPWLTLGLIYVAVLLALWTGAIVATFHSGAIWLIALELVWLLKNIYLAHVLIEEAVRR